uniref:WDR59/RTC1-like RING zinc finger domain-containing protein n=1 Tax=Proboscia inermis TaxID=420281 RepID=A0A7S0CD15_9STRA|mmetsp:Transcript_39633/g.40221  ORF Transcript_39633/g.40221 Transcript_39633/m.40221 type:complete len:273 (+) Transcript_39633:396-1214(+)
MWKILETLLSGSGFEELSSTESIPLTRTALGSVLWSTVCSLLLERAERADVQTCVAICEVFEILGPGESRDGELCSFIVSKSNEAEQCEMDIELVREWYLSYIDILHRKCLFSEATSLIRTCRDPVVAALNQNSTTIHESCPSCGKQLQGVTTIVDDIATNNGDFGGGNSNKSLILTTQRACKNCRRRIGQCFLCHLPVKDLFVWCPGCGHGGHLACAQEWFGGVDSYGEPSMRPQEFCPTGCGHKCNFSKKMWNSPSKRHSLSSTSQMAIS